MKQWIRTLTCLGAVSMISSAFGWGGQALTPPSNDAASLPPSNFPMNADQQWFVKESYLIMKPYEDDNDYASKLTTKGSTDTQLSMSMKLQKPDFDWYSGVRLGLGRYLVHHDKWDLSLFTTYYYANEEDSSTPERANNTLLTPLWSPTFNGGATNGKAVWQLNFFNFDLSIGREYSLLKTVVAHPFIGLRTALIYKDYKAKYRDSFVEGNINRTLNDRFQAKNSFWGIGPRAGVDLQFNYKSGWSFVGNLSGALFMGHYNLKEKISTKVTNFNEPLAKTYNARDDRYTIKANLDAGIGLGWEAWLKNRTVRLAPSVLFEASCWFDTNQNFLVKTTTSTPTATTIPNFGNFRRQGNLILMGFSFNLQADF